MDSHQVRLDYIGRADYRRNPPELKNWTRVYARNVTATAGITSSAENPPRWEIGVCAEIAGARAAPERAPEPERTEATLPGSLAEWFPI